MREKLGSERVSLADLFKMAANVYREGLRLVAAVAVFVYLPLYTIFAVLPERFLLDIQMPEGLAPETLLTALYVNLGIIVIFTPLATATYVTISRLAAEGKKPDLPAVLECSLNRWPKLTVTYLLYVSLIILSSFLIVLPVYFAVSFVFACQVAAVSGKWAFGAFAESRRLIKGQWWFTAVFLALIIALETMLRIATATVLFTFGLPAVFMPLFQSAQGFLFAYFQIVIALYFLNLYYMSER